MRVLQLMLKDLRQVLRDRSSAVFLVLMPAFFMLFFGMTVGNNGSSDPRLPVGLNNTANGTLAASFVDLLKSSDTVRPVTLSAPDLEKAGELVRDGKYTAIVVLPSDFAEKFQAGDTSGLQIIVDQNSGAGQTALNAIRAGLGRLQASALAGQVAAKQLGDKPELKGIPLATEVTNLALAGWQKPPLSLNVAKSDEAARRAGSAKNQLSPGTTVQFAVFGLVTSAGIIVDERRTRSLQRMLTTPIRRVEILTGHFLAMFVLVLIQELILIMVGQFLLGVDYFSQPLALSVVVFALACWAASLGLLIGAISRTEQQVIMLSLICMFVFSIVGGAFFSLEYTGQVFSTIGHLTPTAWAMDGFQNILLRGQGVEAALLPGGILLAYTVAFFGVAVWRFRFD